MKTASAQATSDIVKNCCRSIAIRVFCMWLFVIPVAMATNPLGISAHDTILPLYQERTLTAVVKVGKFFRENRRMGFFRVKLLPQMVLENVRIELQQATLPTNAQEKVFAALKSVSGDLPFEVRDFQIVFPNETTPRLGAQRVKPMPKKTAPALQLEEITIGGKPLSDGKGNKWLWEKDDAGAFANLLSPIPVNLQPPKLK
jgi:hypothetical protein